MSDITVKNEYGTFKLFKDENTYTNYWVCINGRTPDALSVTTIGRIVPLAYNIELYAQALAAGYTAEDLAPVARPEKAASTSRKGHMLHVPLKMKMKVKIAS